MAQDPEGDDGGLRGAVRRRIDRVADSLGDTARGVTEATAQQVIDDLEPYLISEAVPRIVDGITPYLAGTVVPEVLQGVRDHLVDQTVPDVVDGVTDHLIAVTVPRVVEGVTPVLVQDLLPRLLEQLRPYLQQELVPEVVDALLPKIEAEIAPQLVDALMPKIRAEVVPEVLDDIVADPGIRDLIREQSAGLVLDAMESVRENMADVDNVLERWGRRLLRKPPRPEPENGLDLVLDAAAATPAPARTTLDALAQQREAWRSMPMPPPPPGREHAYAGVVTRLAAFAIDVTLTGWLVSQGLTALLGLLTSLFGPLHTSVVAGLTLLAAALVPLYLASTWAVAGRSLGSWVMGTRVCTGDGHNPSFPRALLRALLELFGVAAFLFTNVTSLFDERRRTVMDVLAGTEVRFVVPKEQQNRYLRDALAKRRRLASAQRAGSARLGPAPDPS